MQFQADVLGRRVARPRNIDSTAFGAAQLAGVTAGLWKPEDLERMRAVERVFTPRMSRKVVGEKYSGWQNAVARARARPF